MSIRPIRSSADHEAALRQIEALWSAEQGSPESDQLEVLSILVAAYEDAHLPIGPASPLDMLRYAISDMGRSQKELGTLLGSRSQASDLLKGRRRISLDVAQKISAAWAIPIQLLVQPYALPDAA